MIPPGQQWCIQIDVTNACPRRCSNCTRCLAHAREPFFMTVGEFAGAVNALAEFPTKSDRDHQNRGKVIGIMGGEPLLHPDFPELVDLAIEAIPAAHHRGLWTGLDYREHRHRVAAERLLGLNRAGGGYLNWNKHEPPSVHQPVLVAIREVVRDEAAMWKLIDECWLQKLWSAAITPKGFFFCEVAGALDMIFDGPGGLPIDPQCWRHPLDAYREQIEEWCPRCGVALPLIGRLDSEQRDDVSEGNMTALAKRQSPRILKGDWKLFDVETYTEEAYRQGWQPQAYQRKAP